MKDTEQLVIDDNVINRGENAVIKLNVGNLPSGTRIVICAHVFRSKNPGPVVMVLGGVHGDEINGVEIIRRSISYGLFEALQMGTVIAIPLLNVYGFINFSRAVPGGKDVNRSFPGTMNGSLASQVASVLTRKILPLVDIGIDFHTGGESRYNYPQIRYTRSDLVAFELAKHFAPKFIIQKTIIPGSLRKVCNDMNIPFLIFESGESVRLDGFSIEVGYHGIQQVLISQGMLAGTVTRKHESILVTKTSWIRAPKPGIFIWSSKSGALVRKGEPLGMIHDPQDTQQVKVLAKMNGYILGHNNASVVNQGDALFNIGIEYEKI